MSVGKRKQPHDNGGEEKMREGKIGSNYVATIEGQPFLKDTVRLTPKRDHEVRPREIKE